jgi:hypothetical protein
MFWNQTNPKAIGSYIADQGAYGVTLGWWNGSSWSAMWDVKPLRYVYGWIEIPKYDPNVPNKQY